MNCLLWFTPWFSVEIQMPDLKGGEGTAGGGVGERGISEKPEYLRRLFRSGWRTLYAVLGRSDQFNSLMPDRKISMAAEAMAVPAA